MPVASSSNACVIGSWGRKASTQVGSGPSSSCPRSRGGPETTFSASLHPLRVRARSTRSSDRSCASGAGHGQKRYSLRRRFLAHSGIAASRSGKSMSCALRYSAIVLLVRTRPRPRYPVRSIFPIVQKVAGPLSVVDIHPLIHGAEQNEIERTAQADMLLLQQFQLFAYSDKAAAIRCIQQSVESVLWRLVSPSS